MASDLTIDAQCSRGDCKIEQEGGSGYRSLTVTPRAEGVVRVHVSAKDAEERSFDSDAIEVRAIKKIELTCDAQDERGQTRPCDGPVASGSRVSFEVPPVSGMVPFTAPRLSVRPTTRLTNEPFWHCGEKPRRRAPQEKSYQCLAVDVPPGRYRATATLAGLSEAIEVEVR